MPQPPVPDLTAQEISTLITLLPFLLTAGAIVIRRPDSRMMTGAFLGYLWCFCTLPLLNWGAEIKNWWTFQNNQIIPSDIILGWSIWWGGFLFIAFGGRQLYLAVLMAIWIDILVMPRIPTVVHLGDNWLWGEAAAIITVFIPGWLLAVTTQKDIYLGWRATAQALITGILLLIILPQTILNFENKDIRTVLEFSAMEQSILFNALLIPLLIGLAANQEFSERGKGTPIPFDPPKYLVVTGPYAYVSNPMQISIFLCLSIMALFFKSILLGGSAIMTIIYCLGVVKWHNEIDMVPRFGDRWQNYREHVPLWIPRWQPWIEQPSKVYFARSCEICSATEKWITSMKTIGLEFDSADNHSRCLQRVTYVYPDGSEVEGISAIAACLNHTNLCFAMFGWFIRLPVIRTFLQILIDGTGTRAKV